MARADTRTNVQIPITVEDAIDRIVERKLELDDPNGIAPRAMVLPKRAVVTPRNSSGASTKTATPIIDADVANPLKPLKDALKGLQADLWYRFETEIDAYREAQTKTTLKIVEDDPTDIGKVKLRVHPLHAWVKTNFEISVPEWAPPASTPAQSPPTTSSPAIERKARERNLLITIALLAEALQKTAPKFGKGESRPNALAIATAVANDNIDGQNARTIRERIAEGLKLKTREEEN